MRFAFCSEFRFGLEISHRRAYDHGQASLVYGTEECCAFDRLSGYIIHFAVLTSRTTAASTTAAIEPPHRRAPQNSFATNHTFPYPAGPRQRPGQARSWHGPCYVE